MPTATTLPPDLSRTLYGPIARELAEVESLLQAELRSDHAFVDELVRYGCLLGGKRLRPALVLLVAKAIGGQATQDHITLAAVVEMIHTATLVHDDVLDDAQVRRHLATVNARWDTEASVLLGDFLFTHAFYLASTLDDVVACRLIGRATNIVCEGELRQKGTRANYDLAEAEYLEIVEAKTAELTAVSCRLGALFSAAPPETIEQMDRFGRDLGIAFQIADDLLDVLGEEQTTGKSLGTDLEKQKPTLPLIHALEVASPADRRSLIALLTSGESCRESLLPLLKSCQAIDYARQRARQFVNRARRALDVLPSSPARDVLAAMTEFVVSRSK